jgi:glycosyltransferase involved in cell wall biosynthesis
MTSISVIIPSYNQGRYVAETVESVLTQTHSEYEIIVVDDGSTDDTRTRLTPYIDRIQYIYQANRGLSGARNTGFAASKGEYVLFLDSDDLLHSDALERLSHVLDESPDDGLVYCAWQQINANDKSIMGEVHPRQSGQVLKALLLREFFFFGSSALIRCSVLERVGAFDESLSWGDDADMWLRIGLAGWSFGYIDEPVLQYRVHNASMTASVSLRQIEGWQAGLRKFFASPNLSPDLRALEKQAYAVLYFETAGRYFRAGDADAGRDLLCEALQVNGTPDGDWFLNWVAGTALDPRTSDPVAFIQRVFDNIPSNGKSLEALRWQAQGRYHTAAVFAAYSSHNAFTARQHILPALFNDPGNLTNRGFIKIALRSLWRDNS